MSLVRDGQEHRGSFDHRDALSRQAIGQPSTTVTSFLVHRVVYQAGVRWVPVQFPGERLSPRMSLEYRLLYRLGFLPWDTDQVPAELATLVEGPGALPPGRALDIGCGTGMQAVYLAQQGWTVTGLDVVPRALARARGRAQAAGVEVQWVKGDAGRLTELGVEPGIDLFFDRGCFHGLPARTREAYAEGIAALAAPGATLLLLAFEPNRLPGPSGAAEAELRDRFADRWELLEVSEDRSPLSRRTPMEKVARRWYRFVARDADRGGS